MLFKTNQTDSKKVNQFLSLESILCSERTFPVGESLTVHQDREGAQHTFSMLKTTLVYDGEQCTMLSIREMTV